MKADALMDTLTDTLSEAVPKTLGNTPGDVEAQSSGTLTHCDSLQDLKIELVMHFLCGVEAIKLVKTRTVKVVMVETH